MLLPAVLGFLVWAWATFSGLRSYQPVHPLRHARYWHDVLYRPMHPLHHVRHRNSVLRFYYRACYAMSGAEIASRAARAEDR
eukprot:2480604-Rhodomonas_salina.2